MTPLPHTYRVRLTGGVSGYAELTAAGVPGLQTAPPADFDGPGDAWSPELFLVAAVETCFLFTLRSVARLSKIDIISVDVTTEGTVDRQDGATRFTEIVLRPSVVVAAGTDRDKTQRALEKAEKACLVSASLKTPIRLDARITEQ
ncbi:MAG TPA: OsmC family protein [Vicinamibacterales bacterium]|nr:OsmC family protein [Vicinamibacterales bacterium]